MENKKINENVKEVENKENKIIENAQVEAQVNEQVEDQVEEQGLKLYVGRKPYTNSEGIQRWFYVLNGQVRGRDVVVNFTPKDIGGYEPLDIVFSIAPTAELIMCNETMTDASTGKKTKYTSYKVRNQDEIGVLECGVKPKADSDKALLTMIINQLKATANK